MANMPNLLRSAIDNKNCGTSQIWQQQLHDEKQTQTLDNHATSFSCASWSCPVYVSQSRTWIPDSYTSLPQEAATRSSRARKHQ